MQVLDPLTIFNIRLFGWYVLDVMRIYQATSMFRFSSIWNNGIQ